MATCPSHVAPTWINVDSCITHLQKNAHPNIREGEKKYAREKLDKLFEKLWHEKSFIFVLCFKEILLLLLIPFYPGWKRFFLGQVNVNWPK